MKKGDIAQIANLTAAPTLTGALVEIIDESPVVSSTGEQRWHVRLCDGYEHLWSPRAFFLGETRLIEQSALSTEQLDEVRTSLHEMRDELHDDV